MCQSKYGNENFEKISYHAIHQLLFTNPKSFMKPHLDYSDIIYDQSNNLNLYNKGDTCLYNVALAIISTIRDSLKERLHKELRFKYWSSQRCIRELCTFYKILRNKSPGYLCKYIAPADRVYLTGNSNNINKVFVDQNFFLILFYPRGLRKGISFVWNCVTFIDAVYLKNLY